MNDNQKKWLVVVAGIVVVAILWGGRHEIREGSGSLWIMNKYTGTVYRCTYYPPMCLKEKYEDEKKEESP